MDEDRLLMVATDQISAFDYVLDSLVPDKGVILNQLSLWWFDQLGDLVDNHVESTAVPAAVAGRAVICERLAMIPVECVARGYLTGSGWAEYQASGVRLRGRAARRVWSTARGCPSRFSPRPPRRRWASTTRTSTSPPSPPRVGEDVADTHPRR